MADLTGDVHRSEDGDGDETWSSVEDEEIKTRVNHKEILLWIGKRTFCLGDGLHSAVLFGSIEG